MSHIELVDLYLLNRISLIETQVQAERLAGNEWKEKIEMAALAELHGVLEYIRQLRGNRRRI